MRIVRKRRSWIRRTRSRSTPRMQIRSNPDSRYVQHCCCLMPLLLLLPPLPWLDSPESLRQNIGRGSMTLPEILVLVAEVAAEAAARHSLPPCNMQCGSKGWMTGCRPCSPVDRRTTCSCCRAASGESLVCRTRTQRSRTSCCCRCCNLPALVIRALESPLSSRTVESRTSTAPSTKEHVTLCKRPAMVHPAVRRCAVHTTIAGSEQERLGAIGGPAGS